jgi:hypothetical protein
MASGRVQMEDRIDDRFRVYDEETIGIAEGGQHFSQTVYRVVDIIDEKRYSVTVKMLHSPECEGDRVVEFVRQYRRRRSSA